MMDMPKLSGRFDDLANWMLEHIGLARSAQECDSAARVLLNDAEHELVGLCDDLSGVACVDNASQAVYRPAETEADGNQLKAVA